MFSFGQFLASKFWIGCKSSFMSCVQVQAKYKQTDTTPKRKFWDESWNINIIQSCHLVFFLQQLYQFSKAKIIYNHYLNTSYNTNYHSSKDSYFFLPLIILTGTGVWLANYPRRSSNTLHYQCLSYTAWRTTRTPARSDARCRKKRPRSSGWGWTHR